MPAIDKPKKPQRELADALESLVTYVTTGADNYLSIIASCLIDLTKEVKALRETIDRRSS